MKSSFAFENAGRLFACRIEQPRNPDGATWWWFTVSCDSHRYAPFHATADDTEESVQSRVVAHYNDLLVRRAAPRGSMLHPRRPAAAALPPSSPGDSERRPDQPPPQHKA